QQANLLVRRPCDRRFLVLRSFSWRLDAHLHWLRHDSMRAKSLTGAPISGPGTNLEPPSPRPGATLRSHPCRTGRGKVASSTPSADKDCVLLSVRFRCRSSTGAWASRSDNWMNSNRPRGPGAWHGQEAVRRKPRLFDYWSGPRIAVRIGGHRRIGDRSKRP